MRLLVAAQCECAGSAAAASRRGEREGGLSGLPGPRREFGHVSRLGREGVAKALAEVDARLVAQHKQTPTSKMLAEVPGIGPIGALSLVLRVDSTQFKSGRHFASSPESRGPSTRGLPRWRKAASISPRVRALGGGGMEALSSASDSVAGTISAVPSS
ncbi:MAG: hypothetical protein WAS73_00535 [Defluviicoccus sp.]